MGMQLRILKIPSYVAIYVFDQFIQNSKLNWLLKEQHAALTIVKEILSSSLACPSYIILTL